MEGLLKMIPYDLFYLRMMAKMIKSGFILTLDINEVKFPTIS